MTLYFFVPSSFKFSLNRKKIKLRSVINGVLLQLTMF
ncbi:hypothetical protein KHA96_16825 [Bacillus sp. FJAT-49711]|nr:hypothetical protein [Bacillus sp. FJAT-49711]